jgi:hypothetical protein
MESGELTEEREWKLRREGEDPVERESSERERGDFFCWAQIEVLLRD